MDNDGFVSGNDCVDNNSTIYPGTDEICGDNIDQDCSGSDLECNTGNATTNDLEGTWYMRGLVVQKNGLSDDFGICFLNIGVSKVFASSIV